MATAPLRMPRVLRPTPTRREVVAAGEHAVVGGVGARMTFVVDVAGPQWVWVHEVVNLIDRRLAAMNMPLGEYARQANERFGLGAESVERRLRAARGSDGVMNVHTADRYLVLVGCHLMELPSYRDAVNGDLPRDRWPRRRR